MHTLIIILVIITPFVAFGAWVVSDPSTDRFCESIDNANSLTEDQDY